MRLHGSQKKRFRNYERALFFSSEYPRSHRLYSFYLLLRPAIEWLKPEIMAMGLEPDEAESELYLLAGRLFNKFNKERSSIVPYLEKQLPWEAGNLLKSVQKLQVHDVPSGLSPQPEEAYRLDEEFYWTIPEVLLENRWVGKCFTRAEKYLIYMILASDEQDLGYRQLARACNAEYRRIKDMLLDLQEVFKLEEIHA